MLKKILSSEFIMADIMQERFVGCRNFGQIWSSFSPVLRLVIEFFFQILKDEPFNYQISKICRREIIFGPLNQF